MFDVLAEQTDTNNSALCADFRTETGPDSAFVDDQPTFRTINVLVVETRGNADSSSIVEQCLRYMVGFECLIAQAGSSVAAQFALQADSFDLIITDEHNLGLVAEHSSVPTIIVSGRPSSETTRNAFAAGALHCLPLTDLSPRLLETAINQALSDEA
jgi:DNA-binding NarL/FixJ family response regulator